MKEPGFRRGETGDNRAQLEAFLGTPPKEDDKREAWFKENKDKVRAIIESGYVGDPQDRDVKRAWLFGTLFSYRNFQQLKFNLGSVSCTGLELQTFLGIPAREGSAEFYDFTHEIFPEESEALRWMDENFPHHMPYVEERTKIFRSEPDEEVESGDVESISYELTNLLRENQKQQTKDPIFSKALEKAWSALTLQEELVVKKYIYQDKTFEEIGSDSKVNLTVERVRQIYNKAIRKMRVFLENIPVKSKFAPKSEQVRRKSVEEGVVKSKIELVMIALFKRKKLLTLGDIKSLLPPTKSRGYFEDESYYIDYYGIAEQLIDKLDPELRALASDMYIQDRPNEQEGLKKWEKVEEVMQEIFEEKIGQFISRLMKEYEKSVPYLDLYGRHDEIKKAKLSSLHQAIEIQVEEAKRIILNVTVQQNQVQPSKFSVYIPELKKDLKTIRKNIENLLIRYKQEERSAQ